MKKRSILMEINLPKENTAMLIDYKIKADYLSNTIYVLWKPSNKWLYNEQIPYYENYGKLDPTEFNERVKHIENMEDKELDIEINNFLSNNEDFIENFLCKRKI